MPGARPTAFRTLDEGLVTSRVRGPANTLVCRCWVLSSTLVFWTGRVSCSLWQLVWVPQGPQPTNQPTCW